MRLQRGGFVLGMVVGLLVGLALALGVALYITKAPVPFVNKVPGRTAEQDSAEAQRNKNWDPNAPLGSKATPRAPGAASAPPGLAPNLPPAPATGAPPVATAPAAPASVPGARAPARDPGAILSGADPAQPRSAAAAPDPFVYFVQAGAFTRTDDAEQQRGKLGMLGYTAKITEREQSGRVVYRVRMGPFPTRDQADALQVKLQDQGIEAQIVRVEKP
jgi:cell division protein FtsN